MKSNQRIPKHYCPACGEMFWQPKRKNRGNIAIELILWLLCLLPGVIYSIWRLCNSYGLCPHCGNEHYIPSTSPQAERQLRAAYPAYGEWLDSRKG